jgi:hypothetical protein
MLDKEIRLAEQAKRDRDEFQRILAEQKNKRGEEIRLERERHKLLKLHAQEIRK